MRWAVNLLLSETLLSETASAQDDAPPPLPGQLEAMTPNGLWPTRCLHHIPDGTRIHLPKEDGDGVTLVHANGTSTFLPPCEGAPSRARARVRNGTTSADETESWPVSFWGSPHQPVLTMDGTYTVPSTPKVHGANVVHWWFGAEDARASVVIQPVLSWITAYKDRWAIGSWNCCPAGHQFYGTLFWANVGEPVTGSIKSTGGEGYEVVTTTMRGEKSMLSFDDSLVFDLPLLSLETYDVAGTSTKAVNCAMLPASRMVMDSLRTSPAVGSWGENVPYPSTFDIVSQCGWKLTVNQTTLVASPP
jgi:hypothetical protein